MRPAERTGFDAQMMEIALGVAMRGLGRTAPNPSVGAVIADEAHAARSSRAAGRRPGGRPHAETEAIAPRRRRARAAPPCTSRSSRARTTARRRRAPTPSSAPACAACRVRHRGSRSARRRPRTCAAARGRHRGRARPVVEAAHWIAAGHILRVTERRPFVHRQAGARCRWRRAARRRGQAGVGDRRGGARPRASACAREPTPFWSAGAPCSTTIRSSPAACRAWRTARRCALCWRASLPGSKLTPGADAPDSIRVWVFCGESADAGALGAAGRRDLADARSLAARSGCRPSMEALVARGITRLLVEGGPATWRRSRAPGSSTRRCCFTRAGLTGPS